MNHLHIWWWLLFPCALFIFSAFIVKLMWWAGEHENFDIDELRTLHAGETGFITDDGEGNVSWEPVNRSFGPGTLHDSNGVQLGTVVFTGKEKIPCDDTQ
jgi:hypothetical protein